MRSYKTTKAEIEKRLYAAGARPAIHDPTVKRWLSYADSASDEDVQEVLDKALGKRSITDELYEIR